MPKLLTIILSSLFLTACTVATVAVIKPDQIYQGYPCGDNCPSFRKGFDGAQSIGLKDPSSCQGNQEEIAGCKASVSEFLRTLPTYSDLKFD